MKVILIEDVDNLGKTGEILSVKNGFGRNYLIPNKLALLANDKTIKSIQKDSVSTAFEGEQVADAFFYNDEYKQKWLFLNKFTDVIPASNELYIYKVDCFDMRL